MNRFLSYRFTLPLFFLLALPVFLVFSGSIPEASARERWQRLSPVCSTANFVEFLEAFALVPKEEQMSCIRFSDFTYRGKRIRTPEALLRSEAAASKLLFSRQEINEINRADPRFFYTLPVNMPQEGPATDHSCYMIRPEGQKRFVSLTVGGTFALETVGFEWDGTHWRVTGVIEEYME